MMIDPDDDPEIQQLSIPIQPLIEELTCPICFNNIKDCYMTPCGHNFCSGCIYECVNRKHSCPCCNKATVKDNLVKNHHFDRLATLVTFHKEESSRKYFESIINAKVPQPAHNDQNQPPNSPNPANQQRQLSPIEALFHKHMKRSLLSYEEYYRELQTQHRESVARVQTEYAKLMATAATNEKRDELMQECSRKTQEHDAGFEKASELLTSAYDSYLKEVAPAPASLPVAVTMTVPSKKFRFEGIVLKPSDLVKDARLILEAKMAERGAKIVAWSPANLLLLKKGTEEVILNEEWTVSQYRPPPGAEIAVMGEVQLMSDRPPECFTLTYNASNPQTCDYYTCRDCKFNWICKNCAENCHRGHTVSVYIIGHRSTWACCYCPKNNKCTIQHSKAKK